MALAIVILHSNSTIQFLYNKSILQNKQYNCHLQQYIINAQQ